MNSRTRMVVGLAALVLFGVTAGMSCAQAKFTLAKDDVVLGIMSTSTWAASPEEVVAGFEGRVKLMFSVESGKPLVRARKNPPLNPGRGNYVRHYSWSMMAFATRCLYLGEMLDEANAALAENAQHYLDNPKDINDRDSFHWHAEIAMRLIEMYGSDGSKHAGRITKETEAFVLKPIWEYARKISSLDKAEYQKSKTWHIYQSENHHAMIFTVCWQFSKIAKDRPEYKTLKYEDGATAAEHYRAWNDYFVVYCRERARKSPCIEMMSDGYNSTLIKGFYNFYDFGDPKVRKSASMLLDLYFAYWAQEQIDGVQGGGRSRIYFHSGFKHNRNHGNAPLAWLYFGMGKAPAVYGHDMNAALSDYSPPAVVADIALDVAGRGRYEVRQRPLGLASAHAIITATAAGKAPYKMNTDGGGILRYSYCDPAFIIGTPMTMARPLKDWAAISSQNRWQGVIFAGKEDARIVPIVRPKDNRVAKNAQWSVQSKGSLITQKLKYHKGGAEMIIWMSNDGLSVPVEEDGIIFVEAENAYAGIRVVEGGFKWKQAPFIAEGRTMILNDEYSPVILEVMAKADVNSFDAFKVKMKKTQSIMNDTLLEYTTIYGDQLTLDTSFEKTPTINGKPVDYAPKKVFESPFLNADWNSGIVTISKGKRKKVLDFRNERLTQVTSPQYFVVNLHDSEINDMTFQSLAQLAGDNNGAIRLGASAIFSFLKEPHEVLRDRLKRFMALSEQYNIPIVIQPSGEQYLNARPDLWNWWDPDKPGYDPDNRNNVEWIGWGPEYAIKIAWRNWGSQHRTLPPPNLMSPKYRAACDTELERVIPLILHWWEDLGESKTHLLIAVKMGWESSIGVNAFYYPDGNRLSDQPAAQDPHYGVNSQQLPARGMVTTGYAAATTIGLANSGKLTEAHQAEIVRRHLEAQCKKASMLGVPRDRLFTHVGGFKDEELLYDAAVNQYSCPGWSFYKHARNPARDQGVQRAWKSSDAPHWGAVEWYPHGAQGQEGWSAALNNSFSTPGIRYVCLFNWKSIHKNKEAQQAIQQLVTP